MGKIQVQISTQVGQSLAVLGQAITSLPTSGLSEDKHAILGSLKRRQAANSQEPPLPSLPFQSLTLTFGVKSESGKQTQQNQAAGMQILSICSTHLHSCSAKHKTWFWLPAQGLLTWNRFTGLPQHLHGRKGRDLFRPNVPEPHLQQHQPVLESTLPQRKTDA